MRFVHIAYEPHYYIVRRKNSIDTAVILDVYCDYRQYCFFKNPLKEKTTRETIIALASIVAGVAAGWFGGVCGAWSECW